MLLYALIVVFVLAVCDKAFAADSGTGGHVVPPPGGSQVIQLPPGFDVGQFFGELLRFGLPIVSVAALIAGFVVISKTLKRV